MIVLPGTSDILRLVRSSANQVDVHVSFVDHTTANYTPGRQLATFSSAATGTILAAPAASTQRAAKFISIKAVGGSNTVTVEYFDGATAFELIEVTLSANDALTYTDTDGWRVVDTNGQLKTVAGGGSGAGDGIPQVSAATGSNTGVMSLHFSNISGISFSLSTAASGVTVRASKLQDLGVFSHIGGNVVSSVTQIALSNASGVTWSLSTAANAASIIASVNDQSLGLLSHIGGQSVTNATRLAFSNASGLSFSLSTAAGGATLLGSISQDLGLVSHIGGNVVSSVSQLAFSNASNVTWSLSTAAGGATVIASVAAGGGGGGFTASGWDPYGMDMTTPAGFPASNTMQMTLNPVCFPNVQFDRVAVPIRFSLTTSTHSGTYRINIGIYTRNVSTLSLLHSTTFSTAITVSTGNTSLFQGTGLLTIPWTSTVTEGRYWLGFACGSTSAGANASMSFFRVSQLVSSGATRIFGAASNNSIQGPLGRGMQTATNTSVPSSIGFSALQGVSSHHRQAPIFHFESGTA